MYDSGAEVSIINEKLIKKLNVNKNKISQASQTIITANSSREKTVGRAKVTVNIGLLQNDACFYICEKTCHDIIVGLDLIYLFNLEQRKNGEIVQNLSELQLETNYVTIEPFQKQHNFNKIVSSCSSEEETNDDILQLINKYSNIFAKSKFDVGSIGNEKCQIHLTNNIPINTRPIRHSEQNNQIIKTITDELLETGLISESNSPYSFSVVLANKKDDGKKTRLCVDYRKLNQITTTESYPYPLVGELIDQTINCKFFTTLDVASGFHHIQIAKEDRCKTAFVTFSGKFEWNVMPFGLKNAPAIFQRALHRILRKHKLDAFASNYMDDILIFSKDYQQHLGHIEKVFKTISAENIKLKRSKCNFAKSQVNYLGHTISLNQVKPLKSNIDVIMAIQPPKNIQEVQSFVGHVQYYREFIPNCSALLSPITNLLRKNSEFQWGAEQQNVFDTIKQMLVKEPILAIFDKEKQIHLFTDASTKGIGAVLKQQHNNILKPVHYFSRSLQSYQRNYTITELECLAIVESLKHWHHYVDGKKIIIHSDHSGLQWLRKTKLTNARLARWSIEISQYDYEIVYERGKANIEADRLSRNPIPTTAAYLLDDDPVITKINDTNYQLIINNQVPNECNVINNNLTYDGACFVPQELRKEAMEHVHRDLGHLSTQKMLPHIKQRFKWPNIDKDVRNLVKKCLVCAKNKSRPSNQYGMFKSTIANKPFEIIQIDSVGGMKYGTSRKCYLHLAIDMFSRKVWHICSKTQSTVDFINLINRVICDAKPDIIRSDNYPAMNSKRLRSFIRRLEIRYEHSPPYSPQSIGMVERVNSTIVNQIRTVINDPDINISWTNAANKVIDIYNETIHSTTKFKPNEIATQSISDELLEMVNENNRKSRQYIEGKANINRKQTDYSPGDHVLIVNEVNPNRKKLDELYRGPAVVVEKLSQSRYLIMNDGQQSIHSVRNLKPVNQ